MVIIGQKASDGMLREPRMHIGMSDMILVLQTYVENG